MIREQYDRVWATVNLDALVYNINLMKDNLQQAGMDMERVGMYGIVKADAYGHGAAPAALVIEPLVMGFGVATVDEGLLLRRHGIKKDIVILSTPNPIRFQEVAMADLQPAVYSREDAEKLSEIAVSTGKTVRIHITVDTGMSRIGMLPNEENAELAAYIAGLAGIKIEGVFTHFAKADEPDKGFSRQQAQRFAAFLELLKARGIAIPVRHISNSAAIMELPDLTLDAVRAGISMYGLYPSGESGKSRQRLMPALELKSEITYVKEIEPGTMVSYGGTYTALHQVKVATIPVGYGDGYPRNLSGKGYILVNGQKAPILGRICMDQMMVDVTGINVQAGAVVTLIGRDGDREIRVEELAELSGGFHYEIICSLGKRVPKIYLQNGKVVGSKDYFADQFSVQLH